MAGPTALEQWFLERINLIRLDPERELGDRLNAGLPPGTLSGDPVQPLAMNDLLRASAAYHANWLLTNDQLSTAGEQGSNPGDRMAVAGYDFSAPWSWGESVDRRDFAANASPNFETLTGIFIGRMVDDPTARALLLAPDLAEVGIAQLVGLFTRDGAQGKSGVITLDFASNADSRFVTGMVYDEPLPDLVRSVPNTGTAGKVITGTDASDTTESAGGYAIRAISDFQSITIGRFAVQIAMGDGSVKLDLVNGNKLLSSASINVLTGPYYVNLIGAADADITLDQLSTTVQLTGNRGDNHLIGSRRANQLDGGEGNDILEGGKGDDTYVINDAADIIIERLGEGQDRVVTSVNYILTAGAHVEEMGPNFDIFSTPLHLTGNELSQKIYGNHGNNVLDGGGGADTLAGSVGDDIYIVRNSLDLINEYRTATQNEGDDTVLATVSFALAADDGIEHLETLDANGLAPIKLTGNGFAQQIYGNHGNNVLDGGGGGDTLAGSVGNDIYIVRNSLDLINEYRTATLNEGDDTVLATVNFALAADDGIEHLETLDANGLAPIKLTGNGFGQQIVGNGGNNTLYGLGGDDLLDGGRGVDKLYGGTGNDRFIVSDVGDKVYENAGEGTDTVLSSVTYSLVGQYIENLELTGTSAINGTGNTMANVITGNAADNVLDGGEGGDKLYGGLGSDTFVVDNVLDRAYEKLGEGTDLVLSSISYSLAGQYIENLTLTGTGHIKATGNGFANVLTGNAGSNVLSGGLGADTLFGGGGSDKFLFDTKLHSSNVDTILDFTVGRDKIHLDLDIFSGFATTGALAGAAFRNLATGAVDADDRILFNQSSGDLFYDADGSGAIAAIRFAIIDNHALLTSNDFLLV